MLRRVLLAPLLLLLLVGPVAAASPSPAPTPAPPDPACPTGFPAGSTADDTGDSCFFISGTVSGPDGLPLVGAVVMAKVIPVAGEAPAIASYASTSAEDGTYHLGVLPGYRWRVLLRPTPDASEQLISLSTGSTQAEDAVFSISAEGRIRLDISVDDAGAVRGDFKSIVLQVLEPTPPPAQYNPLQRGGEQAVRLPYDQQFIDQLAATEAAQRNADPLTLFNLLLGSLTVAALGLFALRLNSSPLTVAEQLGRRRSGKSAAQTDIDPGDDPFSQDE